MQRPRDRKGDVAIHTIDTRPFTDTVTVSPEHDTVVGVTLDSLDDNIGRVDRVNDGINKGNRIHGLARLKPLNDRLSIFTGQAKCCNMERRGRAKGSAQSV